MSAKITMQDIADACNLSRNTVSKVFNARGKVPESTRRLVISKAHDLGYKKTSLDIENTKITKNIALFTIHIPERSHYGVNFMSAFANAISRSGYTLMIYEILPEEIKNKQLPSKFSVNQTAGILCIEMFDKSYTDFICNLGLPVILADSYANLNFSEIACDIILMENINSTMQITQHLIKSGARQIGFVGDISHCNSFYERWTGFCNSMMNNNLKIDKNICILYPDSSIYSNNAWLIECIKNMPILPDAFVCANDYLAINLINSLKRLNYKIPEDIMITGFDDSPQACVVEPTLSTVKINHQMGHIAANILLDRIDCPSLPFRCTYVQTTPILRNSSRSYLKS